MALLNSTQLGYLRADGHKSKFYLSVARPSVLLSASVNNGAIARGATAIAFDGGTSVGVSRIKAGATLIVTTTTGTEKVRVAAFTSSGSSPNITGTITVDNNPILWGDNQSLTILESFEPWAIPPTFDANTGISTKRGQTFANQTRQPAPVARAGPHRVGFVEGSMAVSLDGEGQVMTPGASISSYAWTTTIGTLSNAAIANPTLTVSTPGEGWLYLTVTDSNGKSHTGVRHVWAHDPDPESSDYPYTEFEVSGLSLTTSGCRVSFKVTGVADFTQFADGTLLVLWKESWYGSAEAQVSLNAGAEGQLFVGYIVKDSILADAEHGSVTFESQSLTDISRLLAMQALSIHAEATIRYWFQMPTWMTMKHMLHWLLHWHSNLLELTDWTLTTNTKKKKLFTFNDGSIGSQAQDVAGKLVALIGGNKAGQMVVEENIQFLSTAARAAVAVVMDITGADWREQLTVVRRPYPVTAAVELKGYAFDGTTITPYCSVAPTRIRAGRGSKTNVDGMMVSSQADANFLAGRFYAAGNNPLEEIRVLFAGDYSVLDVFPQKWYTTTIASDDTLRGLSLGSIRMVPRTVNLQIDAKNGLCLVDAVFEAEAFGPDGIGVICPTSGDTPTGAKPGWSKTPGSGTSGAAGLASMESMYFLQRDSATSWATYDEETTARHGSVDPFWTIKAGSADPSRVIAWLVGASSGVRRVALNDVSDRNVIADPPDDWEDATPPGADTTNFDRIVSSSFVANRHYVAANAVNDSDEWRAWLFKTSNDFQSGAYATLHEAGDGQVKILSMAEDQEDGSILWLTTWRGGGLYLEAWNPGTMTRGDTISLGSASMSDLEADLYRAEVATVPGDKDALYVFGRMDDPAALSGIQHIIKSTDAAATFSSVESGWGTDYCVALEVVKVNGTNTVYALRQS